MTNIEIRQDRTRPTWQAVRGRTMRKALLVCGIGSSATSVAANLVGALRGDGYSSVNQTVSELTAIDTPSRPVALPIFVASDVLSLAFGTGVVGSAGHNRPLRVAGVVADDQDHTPLRHGRFRRQPWPSSSERRGGPPGA